MLNIRQVKHLATRVGVPLSRLIEIANSVNSFCEELTLLDPAKPHKPRDVLDVRGDLRRIQDRLLRAVLMPKLTPSAHSHGSVRGRHIKTNIEPHSDSVFAFTADISDFYPTIDRNRVYRLFVSQFGCSPDVARLCTRLCTYRHRLALGLVTSPFLAEQVLLPVDQRIIAACEGAGLRYTRYVDDLTISGPYDLKRSGFTSLVREVLMEHGFAMHPDKLCYGRLSDGITITKLVIRDGHPDVRREYLAELNRQLEDASNLATGRGFEGPYYTRGQIAGRVQFVCWVNPGRKRTLLSRFRRIPWKEVAGEAARLGLVAAKKKLIKRQENTVQLD